MSFMKTILLFLCSIIVLVSSNSLNGQDINFNESESDSLAVNIDPRQYVTIHEVRKLKKRKIWQYKENNTNSHQIRKIVDATSEIEIVFDKLAISHNEDFKGNITVEGKIVSIQGGEDPVEVYPYTKVGEAKTKVGTAFRPPSEIASIFVNLIEESLQLEIDHGGASKSSLNNLNELALSELQLFIDKVNNLPQDEYFPINLNQDSNENNGPSALMSHFLYVIDIIPRDIIMWPSIFSRLQAKDKIKNKELFSELERFKDNLSKALEESQNRQQVIFDQDIKDFNNSLKVILEYINYFKSSGEKAEDAFLSITQLNHISLDNIELNLQGINKDIESYIKNADTFGIKSATVEKVQNELSPESIRIRYRYLDAIEQISRLTTIDDSSTNIGKLKMLVSGEGNAKELDHARELGKEGIINNLAVMASEVIYSELNYATISLQKERAQEGDFLYIYVVLRKNTKKEKRWRVGQF